jgi:hypothetical protein
MSAHEVAQSVPETFPDDLYFMSCDDFVKIGRSTNVGNRQRNMQCNNPLDIDCICRLPGRGREETIWHEAFEDDCWRGEWYHRTPALEKAINLARQGQAWWHHLYPPVTRMEGAEDFDEEIVDWHIRVQLHCQPNLHNRTGKRSGT